MAKLLFFDRFHLERLDGFSFRAHQPTKDARNPILRPTLPWERWRAFPMANCVRRDKDTGRYELWYETGYDETLPGELINRTAYATSDDGITWERPSLGQVAIDGSRENSVLDLGPLGVHNANVIRDEHDPDPARRYKMTFFGTTPNRGRGEFPMGITVAHSPDGRRWSLGRPATDPAFRCWVDWRPGMVASGDSHSLVGWVPDRERYVALVRNWALTPHGFRTICYTESRDFLNWSPPVNVLSPDDGDPWGTEFYYMTVRPYTDLFVGVLCVFHNFSERKSATQPATASVPPELAHLDQRLELQLAYSRDLQVWRRVGERKPFLPLGEPGDWDSGMMFGASMLDHDDELWLYYGGTPMRHIWEDLQHAGTTVGGVRQEMCGGLARLRRDGFVSLSAGATTAETVTKPIQLTTQPRLNLRTFANGWLTVQLLDAGGAPIPSAPPARLCGDRLDAPLELSPALLDQLRGEHVKLLITAANAELFAIEL